MLKKLFSHAAIVAVLALLLTSCGGTKSLIIPTAVSSADAIQLRDLNLERQNYDVLHSVSETAAIRCTFKKNTIIVEGISPDNFYYKFFFDPKAGWTLNSFSGVANLGYFATDLNDTMSSVPNPAEFSRRAAMARIIGAINDYDADGVIEPVVTTIVKNGNKDQVIFTSTVRAKLVKVKTN